MSEVLISFAVLSTGTGDMKLIMESGATKTDCCLMDSRGKVHSRFRISGINAATMDIATVSHTLGDAVSCLMPVLSGEDSAASVSGDSRETPGTCGKKLPAGAVAEVFFYGAGVLEEAYGNHGAVRARSVLSDCSGRGQAFAELLDKAFDEAFPGSVREYHTDLLAAARGLCGDRPGIVAILGTGSNSCLYDGKRILKNIRPGGFILGDEGSAAALGRLFLADYIKELLPQEISEDFRSEYGLDYAAAVRFVYGSDAPARNLASLAPYVMKWSGNERIGDMIARNFRDFLERCLLRYGRNDAGVYVTGSFGTACKDVLERLGSECGLEFKAFVQAPMDGLVRYHSGLPVSSGCPESCGKSPAQADVRGTCRD